MNLVGAWIVDRSDARALADLGDVLMLYTIRGQHKNQIIKLRYQVAGSTILTEQPSAPRVESTAYSLTEDGVLTLTFGGVPYRFVRANRSNVDGKSRRQGWSPGWLAVKFILAVPTLGVICFAFVLILGIAVDNMMDVCPRGFHIGHFSCDVSLIVCLILLLIAVLGACLLLWIFRLEVIWNRFQQWLARNARKWHEPLDR